MTNTQMQTLNKSLRKMIWILKAWRAGRTVYTVTYGKSTGYNSKHRQLFKVNKDGIFVKQGRGYNCLNFTNFKAM